jgi:hypothetical protein
MKPELETARFDAAKGALRIKISEAGLAATQDHSRDRNRNVDGQQGA